MSFRELSFLVSCFSLKCILDRRPSKEGCCRGEQKMPCSKFFFISFLIFSEFWNGILSSMVFFYFINLC